MTSYNDDDDDDGGGDGDDCFFGMVDRHCNKGFYRFR